MSTKEATLLQKLLISHQATGKTLCTIIIVFIIIFLHSVHSAPANLHQGPRISILAGAK